VNVMSKEAPEETTSGPAIQIEENEVAQIIESIQEAEYFDFTSMAPLTPASLVRLNTSRSSNHIWNLMIKGCCSSIEIIQTTAFLSLGPFTIEQKSGGVDPSVRRPARGSKSCNHNACHNIKKLLRHAPTSYNIGRG
jgi:hypothetical protein